MSLKRLLLVGGVGLGALALLIILWPKPKVVQVTSVPQNVGTVSGNSVATVAAQPTADVLYQQECVKAQSSYNTAMAFRTVYYQQNYYADKATVEMLGSQLGGPAMGYTCYLPNLPTFGLNLSGITIIPRRVIYYNAGSPVYMQPTTRVAIGSPYVATPQLSTRSGNKVTVIRNVPPAPRLNNPSLQKPGGAVVLPSQNSTALPRQNSTALPQQNSTALPRQNSTALPPQNSTALPTQQQQPRVLPTAPIVGGTTVPKNTAINQQGSTGNSLTRQAPRQTVQIPSNNRQGASTSRRR